MSKRLAGIGLACAVAGAAAVLSATAPLPAAAPARQATSFRSSARVVPVYATVTDGEDRLVPDLSKGDFDVLDNNVRQDITFFENQSLPITSVVMLDTSGSMTEALPLVKAAAEQFLERLLPQDKAQVGAFNDKIQFSGVFTSDRDDLAAALKDLDFGYPTRLYDAIDQSVDRLSAIDGRRVIVLLTDGEDTTSKKSQGAVLDRAREA